MSKLVLCLVFLSAVGLAACGGSSSGTTTRTDSATTGSASASTPAEEAEGPTICEDASLGTFEGQTWSATEIEATDVDCDEAQEVAAQWAAQQVGGPSAKLPAGWSCESICRKGSASVSFTLSSEG